MGFLDSISNASIYLKITAVLKILIVAFAWTSFVTAAWGDAYLTANSGTMTGYGLWRTCGDSEITSGCTNIMGWNLDWYRAVQAFAVMGFASANVGFCFILLIIFAKKCTDSKSLRIWLSMLGFWAAICYLIAVIVFGAKFDSTFSASGAPSEKLQYGWGLALTVCVLEIVVGVLMFLESKKKEASFMDL